MDTAKEILAMIKDMIKYILDLLKDIFPQEEAEGEAEVK